MKIQTAIRLAPQMDPSNARRLGQILATTVRELHPELPRYARVRMVHRLLKDVDEDTAAASLEEDRRPRPIRRWRF